jgi:hypothetical protein
VSVWNRIGDIASGLGKGLFKFAKDVVVSPFAGAKFAWDIGTAPWNDKAEYNGFMTTVKTAASGPGKTAILPLADAAGAVMKVPGLGPALEWINRVNRDYIREPLTTVALMSGDVSRATGLLFSEGTDAFQKEVQEKGLVNPFNPNTYSKYYRLAQDITPGQAVLTQYRVMYDPKFNIYDPAERDAAFKQSSWGWALSGTLDFGINIFGDITLVGGKATKWLKASELGVGELSNADKVARAAEQITKAQAGEVNNWTKPLNDFTKNDSIYALNHPMVKSSSNPGLLAHLLGNSTDVEQTALILRSALSDPAAMDELRLARADITDALETARGKMSAVDEYKLFAAPDGSGMIPFLNDDPGIIKEAKENYAALAKNDQYFSKLMQLGEGGGSLTRTTGPLSRGIDDFVAKSRAVKFYDREIGNPNIEVFQPTPFHRLYQKISWAANERPAGIVDLNDPDSYKEIIATLNVLGPQTGPIVARPFVKTLNIFDEAESRKFLEQYMAAATPEARSVVVINLENAALRKIAQKYDIDEQVANRIYNNYRGARMSAMKSIKDNGFMVDTDNSIIKVPVFESQTADNLPVMDFLLLDRVLNRNKSPLGTLRGYAVDGTLTALDYVQDLFKAGALLRLGYTIRNGIDSQLRIASAVGAMASLRHLGPGLKNVINDAVRTPSRYIDRYRPVSEGLSFSKLQEKTNSVIKELDELKSEIDDLNAKVLLNPNDLDLAEKLNTKIILQEQKQAVYESYTNILNKNPGAKPKDRIGVGTFRLTTADGQTYDIFDAYGGRLGDMFRRYASSGNTFQRVVDSNASLLTRKMSYKGMGAINPTDPGYFEQWAQTLRQQFGNSAVASKLAKGESVEDVTKWLRNTPEGRDLRGRLSIPSRESAEYVTKVNGFLDKYLPAQSGLRSKLGEITANDLRTAFKDPTELPIIHGHILEENIFNVSKLSLRNIFNSAFKFLGTLPEDTWARNPLYIYYYRQEAKRRLDIMAGLKKDRLTLEEQNALMSASHKAALRDMKGVLFNIERRTNLATLMKYISPFFSAQENAYKTWLKLAVANPTIVNRGYMVWNAPNRAGLVTDQEGNIVPPGETSGNDIIWVGLPKGISKIPFFGKGTASLNQMGIPKASLDILFQGGMDVLYMKGNPNVFSDIFPVGPYVGIPVSELVKKKPSLEDSFKWALPYGPSKNALSGLLPAWVQRLQTREAGLDDAQFARTYQLIWNTEQQKAKQNGLPPVSQEKILKMTQHYWNMRVAANLILPFAPRFDSPYKFYMDKSREYKRLYGVDADAKFFDDYPEFFSFTTSLSSNPTNIQSSVAAVGRLEKYSGLVGELANIEPRLVGTITNDFSGYEFSQAAYSYLYKKKISAGSRETFLSSQDPALAQKRTEAEKGWIQYNRFMDEIDNALQDRGLSSTQQKGAEDLKIAKEAFIAAISRKKDNQGNFIVNEKTGQYEQSAWYDDYLDSDGSKTNRVIVGLGKILNDEKFMADNKNNVTWKSIGAYLDFRKAIAADLMQRKAKSINAKSNIDIKLAYDSVVNKLKQDDKMGFAYIYDRFLSQDLIVDKYLTPIEEKK